VAVDVRPESEDCIEVGGNRVPDSEGTHGKRF
jgi:hypothetical protein